MQKRIRVNAFAAMKLEKQVRKSKTKQHALRHFERLRAENRELQNNVQVITTIY